MSACLERLKALFAENGVRYETQRHRTVFTSQAVAAELHEKGEHVAKVVIAWADGKLVMLVLAAPDHVDFEQVAKLLGADYVRAAREDEFKFRFPDCEPGAMPPFGHLYQMPTYLDRKLSRQTEMVLQAGTHQDTLKISMADYLRLAAPSVADFALQAHPAEHAG